MLFSRRQMLAGAAGAAALPLAPPAAAAQPDSTAAASAEPAAPGASAPAASTHAWLFFNDVELRFIRAAVDRLIPPDETWAGAADAGVAEYLDRQLAGAYGNGSRMYLDGPWAEGTPEQGYQLPFTPAQLYREALRGITSHLERTDGGRSFDQLTTEEQDGLLRALEAGTVSIGDIPAAVFFETLLANTIEGFFADPVYGGNRAMVGWRMVGFPGAYAQFVHEVDQHGMQFNRPPMSMAQGRHDAHGEASWPPG